MLDVHLESMPALGQAPSQAAGGLKALWPDAADRVQYLDVPFDLGNLSGKAIPTHTRVMKKAVTAIERYVRCWCDGRDMG